MATAHQVRCIIRGSGPGAENRIQGIGGVDYDHSPWQLSQDEAVAGIDDGSWTFYVKDSGGAPVSVLAASTEAGVRFLATESDETLPLLLDLPQCS